ncbi:sulfite exporter TauE/SafE family protein [Vibrio hepatarius]|uniref:sulfite exporter TauE/SafE family protein n=1 Tax=Vibrio hepatarius TaxID=171383 RepID=UPI001C09E5D2|nr:sulfite exporter TauE/SafE family protein [Vibrio hepatarius]MBU2898942.1 sulfite exporter TauE/SafE family protein [Vibrio hepatarius]
MTPDWLGAFLIGVIGAGHCMGMCGGIASLLSTNASYHSKWTPIFYNLGRMLSYSITGAVVGGTIASVAEFSLINNALTWLRVFAAFFMILLAFYIGRWWHGLVYIESIGQRLWRLISPAGRSLLPLKSPLYALPFGFVWGWLPCGLVYSTLTWAAVSGSALNGALIMASFGIGTLPAMLFVGFGTTYLSKLNQSNVFRQIGAILILFYGIYTAVESSILLLST